MATMKTPTPDQLANVDVAVAMLHESQRLFDKAGRVEMARRIKPVLIRAQASRARAWRLYRRANPDE